MRTVYFDNVELRKDVYYFLYVGEIKGYCLNEFLKETLEKRKKRPVDFISIVPDVWENYTQRNLVVINPLAENLMGQLGSIVHVRIPGRHFAGIVSSHAYVRRLVESLMSRQNELYIHVFQTFPELTIADGPNVMLLGPAPRLSDFWNSKLNMYRKLHGVIPLPPFYVCQSKEDLLKKTRSLWKEWKDGIFVSLEYSAAGAFSFLARSEEELLEKLGSWKPPYLITRFIPHEYDPTVLGVVANEREVFIGCVADQCMEQMNKFRGSTFPSVLPEDVQETLREITRRVGKEMARTGYRGIFGCDYVIDDRGRIYFVEVNARKQGTTMEMCCTLENSLPNGCPNLMEIEFHAITRKQLPSGCKELADNPAGIFWGTYNFKLEKDAKTIDVASGFGRERDIFEQVADDSGPESRFMIVEHVGKNIMVKAGSFVGRVISVGKSRESMLESLDKGKSILKKTIEGAF